MIILPTDYNVTSSYMKDATHNKLNSFDIGTHVTLFGLNNTKFNGKYSVIKSLPARSFGPTVYSPPLTPPYNGSDTLIRK